ncbi:pyridoxamine 5'-phosphate oxidase family protein (plasmid) [Leisingera caerulea]|uniref:2Fe-2S iron-sulfur cluster-binding protein n=1 Tax=Leisingera caerulea TaxID=506591 RepID=UPI0021A4DAB5|nr:pyridoxamine 5'-phosphate oxidase family protein [Leisingera caerulea]UWQ64956.1 pyridoxamine 5'-phosphate oxidase family protein [Leisingera caerulea]
MTPLDANTPSPFHEGEQEMQHRAGKREMMETFGRRVIRSYMPDQHRLFYAQLPVLAAGAVDSQGWPWASLLAGPPGFAASPDPQHLDIALQPDSRDPVQAAVRKGAALGMLGIELHSRRRNRVNGRVSAAGPDGFTLRVDQSFGNCPQYIQLRGLEPAKEHAPAQPQHFTELGSSHTALIAGADMFFVASHIPAASRPEREGVDVSHRGGRPGFVRIDGNCLTIPDFPGNNHFNTLGNFLLNPRAGLVFPDFTTGSLLLLTGTVELLDETHPEVTAFDGAERGWRFTLHKGTWLEGILPLRAERGAFSPNTLMTGTWAEAEARAQLEQQRSTWRRYRVARTEMESTVIRSFYLEPEDGGPLLPFEAGQFLTIRITPPDAQKPLVRTYTVSSAPGEGHYRISVKREEAGTVSRHLHAHLETGAVIEAKAPRGGFFLDTAEERPAVLIAGGVGVTPMIAMARHALREGVRTRHLRPLTILHAARTLGERSFAREFRNLEQASGGQIRYVSLISAPAATDTAGRDFDLAGRLTADVLQQLLPPADADVHLCGPGGFMQAAYDGLLSLGVKDADIHAEAFGPSALQRSTDTPNLQDAIPEADSAIVRFKKSGFEQPWTPADGTLLELAERHGLTPEFSCRAGNCGSCATRLLAGKLAYRAPPSAAPEDGGALICCAVPATGTIELDL